MFFHLGKIVTRFRWLNVGVWMGAIAIALPFAPQATQVLHSGDFVSPDFESEQAITLLAQKLHFDPTIHARSHSIAMRPNPPVRPSCVLHLRTLRLERTTGY
jgi:uncharacterized membrane protein YdfJ with MMPL/SSD domain